ncbi:MAG: 3-deoxy-D-manno-octulosonic acid transferase [Deltaproteobacteria bacterium]|nr:3-deoxy-D-manno-octulosonic acid transferase [Deltaproteobacteria bacterium]
MAVPLQYWSYKLLSNLFFAIGFPPFFLYSWFTGKHKDSLHNRLGSYGGISKPLRGKPSIWMHAASAGEVRAAQALLPELQKILPDAAYLLSTMTQYGQQVAKKHLGSALDLFYAPLDANWIVKRSLASLKPTCYICLETELWPNLLTEAYRAGIPLFLLNGRLSARSLQRYKKIPKLMTPLLNSFTAISVISETDKERFAALGADTEKIIVSGNAKYDLKIETSGDQASSYRYRLGIRENQQAFIFGSTHSGEEKLFVDAICRLREHIADAIFIIAPRHLNRLAEIENLFSSHGLKYDIFSRISPGNRCHNIVLLDTMGELSALYSVGTFIYCGGSLVPKGGHNIMEAAIWGKPVYYGPHMKDFADAAEILESRNAAIRIKQPDDFVRSVLTLLGSPREYAGICRRSKEVAMAQQGSSRLQAELIRDGLRQRKSNN